MMRGNGFNLEDGRFRLDNLQLVNLDHLLNSLKKARPFILSFVMFAMLQIYLQACSYILFSFISLHKGDPK